MEAVTKFWRRFLIGICLLDLHPSHGEMAGGLVGAGIKPNSKGGKDDPIPSAKVDYRGHFVLNLKLSNQGDVTKLKEFALKNHNVQVLTGERRGDVLPVVVGQKSMEGIRKLGIEIVGRPIDLGVST